jgi:AraC-like DNA-binding protein
MDQRSIVVYLSMRGYSAIEIHNDLVETLGAEAVGYSTVTHYLRDESFPDRNTVAPDEKDVARNNRIDKAILTALAERPFSSVRQIATQTCLARSTVHRHLTQSLGFTVRHLHWIPHRLSDNQKEIRVRLSQELLQILQRQQARAWHDIVTLDESWFYFQTDHERIWLTPEQPVPDRERHMIQSPKIMLTVVWSPNGFCLLAVLPKGTKFNAEYYVINILEEIKKYRRRQGGSCARKLIVHADNARAHTAQLSMQYMAANKMKPAPHPPYPPDLAPSDFFLFGDIKRQLGGCSFNRIKDLHAAVKGILLQYEKTTLTGVFNEWIRRLQECIQRNGDYVA